MKRIIVIFMLIILLALGTNLTAGTYSGGTGVDANNAYLISTTADLIELSNTSGDWGRFFKQTVNIVFDANEQNVDWDGDGSANWDTEDQLGFSPIGNLTNKFTGTYDGDVHTVSNLFINRPTDYNGLFGFLSNATVTDLTLANINYTGNIYVGGIAGRDELNTTISGCTISGIIVGFQYIGGLIGLSNTAYNITNCHFSGTISATASNVLNGVGGVIGDKGGTGTISECSSSGTINGIGTNHGGFVGWIDNGEIRRCFTSMNVISTTSSNKGRIGGFVGATAYYQETAGQIYDCYATGNVTANSTSNESFYGIGGFVGAYYDAGGNKIYNSYSTGAVSATSATGFVGGFSGEEYLNDVGAVNCFWDITTSGQVSTGEGETGKTTAEMKDLLTFTETDTEGLETAWDFETNPNDDSANNNYWDIDGSNTINSGYPFLSWQNGDEITLPIELSSFTAIATLENYAQINWITHSETDLSGYNLYRNSEISSENSIKINANLISGNNSSTGANYEFIDENVTPIAIQYYWLESVDLDGSSEMFGPVSINFAGNYLVVQNTEIASKDHKSVSINWNLSDVSEAVIFYDVYRNDSFNFENSVKVNSERIYIEDGYELNYEFTDENIELGENYFYWITANNFQNTLMVFNPINIEMNHLEFSDFSASTNSQKININWQTSFEIEVDSYQIMKSATSSILDAEIIYNSDAENNLYETSYNFSDEAISQGETYFYWVKGFASNRNDYLSDVQRVEVPFIDLLIGNYPNPFNPTTTIKFSVENPQNASLSIFNLKGQKIRSFEITQKGEQEIVWNGKDDGSKKVSSGVYFINLKSDNSSVVKKALMLK